MFSQAPPQCPNCFVLCGPTGSGKTELSLALASRWPIEIISVDSAQVYQMMDIGTAKPTLDERKGVPHHLIDICDPREVFNASRFVQEASHQLQSIRARNKIPLLVGGTMLYYQALFSGLHKLPSANPEVRADLEATAKRQGWPFLYAKLQAIDAISAQKINPHDKQRITRALEVYELTKIPLSTWITFAKSTDSQETPHYVSLEPSRREVLHERLNLRVQRMLKHGFIEEVQALTRLAGLNLTKPSMRSVGYRQIWDYLHAIDPSASTPCADLERLSQDITAKTRQLAKRQLTWLRSIPERTVIDLVDNNFPVLEDLFKQWLDKYIQFYQQVPL